jgi:hypothetical protein
LNAEAIDTREKLEFPDPIEHTFYPRSRAEEFMANTPFGDIYVTFHGLLSFSNASMNFTGLRGQRARTPFQKLNERFEKIDFVPAENVHKLRFLTERHEKRDEVFNVEVWKQSNNGFHYVLTECETTLFNQPTKLYLDDVVALSYENIEEASARFESK